MEKGQRGLHAFRGGFREGGGVDSEKVSWIYRSDFGRNDSMGRYYYATT